MSKIIYPPKKGNFYLLRPFLTLPHDSISCDLVYIIPWIDGALIVTRRNCNTQGCIGCVVRRLLSTIYHIGYKINGIDSIWCVNDLESDPNILEQAKLTLETPRHPTLCHYYKWNSNLVEDIHVIPVPGCPCSMVAQPNIEISLAREWLHQWPNIILKKTPKLDKFSPFHILTSCLPNTAMLFEFNSSQPFHQPSNPTAAAYRSSPSLYNRLLGESIERYSLKYCPAKELFLDKNLTQKAEEKDLLHPMTFWTSVLNIDNKKVPLKAHRIYNTFYRLHPDKYFPVSSSGVAAHFEVDLAKCNALFEVLERDALLTSWRLAFNDSGSCLMKIPDGYFKDIREHNWLKLMLEKRQRSLIVLGVKNQFGLPICLVVSLGNENAQQVNPIFGSGIAFKWKDAIKKALNEILQGIDSTNLDLKNKYPSTFIERPAYWSNKENSQLLNSFLQIAREFDSSSNIATFQELIVKLKKASKKVYFANITPPDVKLGGWHVIRAIVSDVEPFVSNYIDERPSLARVNRYLKSAGQPLTKKINSEPFPYP